jgi:predicted permease
MIYLWVRDEMSIDNFFNNEDRIYHIWENRVKADGIWTSSNTSALLPDAMVADMPEIEYACGSTRPQPYTLSVGEKTLKIKGQYSGKDFFKIFSYPLIYGDPALVLADKSAVVISESLARKFFNSSSSAVGKTIELDHSQSFMVTGVFKDIPQNATDYFEFVLSFEKFRDENPWSNYWGNTGTATYVLLKKDAIADNLNKKIADYVKVKTNGEIKYRTMFLKKYKDIYLYGQYENGVLSGGRITYVRLFSLIAVFILLIACINFMNLSTAKASRRLREVGIKKAVGAGRKTLIVQYLGESLLMSFLSMAMAILIVDICLSPFNEITGKQLSLSFNTTLIMAVMSIGLITGVIAGSYPALHLSAFNPATVLKGKQNTSVGELWSRKGLVIFQFTLSIIMIVSVFVVYRQIRFVQNTHLGYDRSNIIYFYREGKLHDLSLMETFLAEVRRMPGVMSASSSSHNMTGHNSGTSGLEWAGKDPEDRTEFERVTCNYDLIETLGVQMVSGRPFSREFPADTAKLIITEAGIKFMGLSDPIGAKVKLWGMDMEIIGVARDFHYESLHENVKPVFFNLNPSDTYLIMIKLAPGNQAETIKKLSGLYQKLNPGFSFDYLFLDEKYQNQYAAEQRVATLSRYFAGLAILISCLGLLGLAAFTAERRLKEIGIRKVLGASEASIVTLMSADFTRIVLIAIVIALPMSYFLSTWWLSDFAYRITLEWWYFAAAGFLALIIAWITVGTQALKAARVNPARCLKVD